MLPSMLSIPSITSMTKSANMISNALTGMTSPFTNYEMQEMSPGQYILFIFILFMLIYFTMFIGSLIFNISVVKIFPSIKKIDTMDFFGLYIVLHMLFC